MKTTRFLFSMLLVSALMLSGCIKTDEAPEVIDFEPVIIDEVVTEIYEIDEITEEEVVEPVEAEEVEIDFDEELSEDAEENELQ